MTLRTCRLRLREVVLIASLCVSASCLGQAQPPKRQISNGLIQADVYLPDASNGFYRGTRFDWAGVIGNFKTLDHTFYGPWFTGTDPKVRDFEYRGPQIIAGPCSAITGPAEEFLGADSGALGYAEAKPGGSFLKIGVGMLRKPDGAAYDPYRLYEIVDGGQWSVDVKPDGIQVTQRISDAATGYGYTYRKAITLVKGKREMRIEHFLLNTGKRPIDARVYDHNFLVLDHQTTGPAFEVRLPYPIHLLKPLDATTGMVEGGFIKFRKPIEGEQRFSLAMSGFSKDAKDYHVAILNREAKVQIAIQGDRPLHAESLWAIRSTLAVEPFVKLNVPAGQTVNWSYTYRYSMLSSSQP